MEPASTESDPRPALPRTLVTILLALAGATDCTFGLGAIRGIVTPVFPRFRTHALCPSHPPLDAGHEEFPGE